MVAGDVMKIWVKLAVCVLGTYGAFLSSAAQDVVTTVIGGGPNGLPGVDANITYPNAIAADAVGNVYIASANMGRVFKISTIGVLTVFAGTGTSGYSGDGGPAVKAGLIGPSALAVDTASPANVYISDGCLVRMVNGATGVITTVAGLVTEPATGSPSVTCGFSGDGGKANAASLSHPGGLAVNPVNNDLYVADGGNNVVRKIAGGIATGTITTVAGTGVVGTGFSKCQGKAPYGDGAAATSAYLCGPSSVALDTSTSPVNLFISEASNYYCDMREVVGSSGRIYQVAGNFTLPCGFYDDVNALSAALSGPGKIIVSVSGPTTTVQVADSYRIRQFTLTYVAGVPTPGTITTIAGNGQFGFCNEGGPALNACMDAVDFAYDLAGNYYIADDVGSRVHKVVKSTTLISTIAGWGPVDGGQPPYSDPVGLIGAGATPSLYEPLGVYADPTSTNVYVSGLFEAVYRWDSAKNQITGFAGSGAAGFAGDGGAASSTATQLNGPTGIGKDSSGNIYIADFNNNVIRKVDPSTGVISTAAGVYGYGCDGGAPGLNPSTVLYCAPTAVVFDARNNMYIADYFSCAILKITASSSSVTTLAGGDAWDYCGYSGDGGAAVHALIGNPSSIALDRAGNVYFFDQANYRVREIVAQSGIIRTVAGNGSYGYTGDGPATSNSLTNGYVTADPNGNLFISDTDTHILRWVTSSGDMITFAGTPSVAGFSGDGAVATHAQFNYPAFLSRDSAGNTYVADEMNNRIRQVTPFAGYGLSSASLQFGTQPAGTEGDFRPVTVSAVGPTTFSGVKVTGSFSEIDNCTGHTLTAGQTCEIDVYFQPSTPGSMIGSVSISSNAFFSSNPTRISLSGTAVGLKLVGSLAFGTAPMGTPANTTLTLTNSGAAATLSRIYLTSVAAFRITGGTCPVSGGSLPSGASCTLIVRFSPLTAGSQKSTLVIESSVPASPLLAQATGVGKTCSPSSGCVSPIE
jgi:hypothetical protein